MLEKAIVKFIENHPEVVQKMLKENFTVEMTCVNGRLVVYTKYAGKVVSETSAEISCK